MNTSKYKNKHIINSSLTNHIRNVDFEGHNKVSKNNHLSNVFMGKFSYTSTNTSLSRVKIGKFTSIGPNVLSVGGEHPVETFVSTHPIFYSLKKQIGISFVKTQMFEEYKYVDINKNYHIIIGNDVWIASNVLLLEGITIGNGAVIAAGAVVTKDIPPYAIVGGVPAKLIRYRFSSKKIEYLQKLNWWDKDVKWIHNNAHLFSNIENLKSKHPVH